MHRVALMRLRRAQRATEDYFRVRYDQRLDETFNDWGTGICEADRAPATKTERSPSATAPERGAATERTSR